MAKKPVTVNEKHVHQVLVDLKYNRCTRDEACDRLVRLGVDEGQAAGLMSPSSLRSIRANKGQLRDMRRFAQ